MREIPQKGWYIHKEDGEPTVSGTKVYLDGRLIGGIQRLSIEIDAEKFVPVIKMEVIPFEGLVLDASFGELSRVPEPPSKPTVFRSTSSPEEILRGIAAKEGGKPENEVL